MQQRNGTRLTAALALGLLVGCGANTQTGRQFAPSTPKVTQMLQASVAYAQDEQMLVDQATLVVVGAPVGTPEEEVVDTQAQAMFANYSQTIRMLEVLKGTTSGDTVRIARIGVSSQGRAQGAIADDLRGPLPPGRQILFLMPSGAPAFYEVVGHASGELPLNDAGRVTGVRPQARELEDLDIPGVRKKIAELEAAP